jgi:hypothetical protein
MSSVSKTSGFVTDSSRSYANCFWLNFGSGRFDFSNAASVRRKFISVNPSSLRYDAMKKQLRVEA